MICKYGFGQGDDEGDAGGGWGWRELEGGLEIRVGEEGG